MSKVIITKRCSKCKQIKSLSEFYKNRTQPDGHSHYCKICHYANQKKHTQTDKGKKANWLRNIKYRQSEKGKKQRCLDAKKYYQKNKLKAYARMAISYAIVMGKFPRPDSFQCACSEPAEQYHHYKGYDKKHWFDVVPVCIPCHKIIHPNKTSVPLDREVFLSCHF